MVLHRHLAAEFRFRDCLSIARRDDLQFIPDAASISSDRANCDERLLPLYVPKHESRETGLGARFEAAANSVPQSTSEDPERYREVARGVRKARVQGFPYLQFRQKLGRLFKLKIVKKSFGNFSPFFREQLTSLG
jgi:hypothetical protein